MKRETNQTLDRTRLVALLDAYGADAERWPEHEQAAALVLLQRDPEARALRAQAARLDAVLAVVEPVEPSPALVARILGAAPSPAGARRRPLSFLRIPRPSRAWRYVAAAAPLAAAAALTLWLVRSPEPIEPLDTASLAQLGTYETPGDELLGLAGVDLFNTDPWSDCADALLGCPDSESVEDDPLSRSAHEMETYS